MSVTTRIAGTSTGRIAGFLLVAAMSVGFGGPCFADDAAPVAAAVKRDYRRPPPLPAANPALVDLGRDLFFDPRVSASGKTACATCHVPQLGYSVTDAHSRTDSGTLTSRKSQPLIGLGYAGEALVGWDGRSPTLEAQVKGSIVNGSMSMRETPTPVKAETIEERIAAVPDYATKFKAALPGKPVNLDSIATAIAAFERTLDPGTSPFDRWIAGDEAAIPDAAKRGFALFTGKAACSGCHSGWRFTDDQFHDIGLSSRDRGRGAETKDRSQNYAFKTPTLRSVAVRPPYMHDGSIATLADVVRHYEQGGVARPSRSPLLQPIDLTGQERQDLVAFLQTLTAEQP
jgi:cytochrome c peroxidase